MFTNAERLILIISDSIQIQLPIMESIKVIFSHVEINDRTPILVRDMVLLQEMANLVSSSTEAYVNFISCQQFVIFTLWFYSPTDRWTTLLCGHWPDTIYHLCRVNIVQH